MANQLIPEPTTLSCFDCRGTGRVWKGAQKFVNLSSEEAWRRVQIRRNNQSLYMSSTEVCETCKGSGEIVYPGLKR